MSCIEDELGRKEGFLRRLRLLKLAVARSEQETPTGRALKVILDYIKDKWSNRKFKAASCRSPRNLLPAKFSIPPNQPHRRVKQARQPRPSGWVLSTNSSTEGLFHSHRAPAQRSQTRWEMGHAKCHQIHPWWLSSPPPKTKPKMSQTTPLSHNELQPILGLKVVTRQSTRPSQLHKVMPISISLTSLLRGRASHSSKILLPYFVSKFE